MTDEIPRSDVDAIQAKEERAGELLDEAKELEQQADERIERAKELLDEIDRLGGWL